MSKIKKALRRLTKEERQAALDVVRRLIVGDHAGLNIKKLQNKDATYRVRVGKLRIIYLLEEGDVVEVVDIVRRSDTTYNL